MSLDRHAVPEDVLRAMARGGGGEAAVAALTAAQRSRTLLLIRGVRDRAIAIGHPQADLVRRCYDLLAEIERAAGADAVLGYPTVSSWALRALTGLAGDADAARRTDLGRFAGITAAAAVRAGFPAEIEVPLSGGTVLLPSLGVAVFGRAAQDAGDPATVLVRSSATGVELAVPGERITPPSDPHRDGPGWCALPLLTAGHQGTRVGLVLDEHDPDRMPGARLAGERLTAADRDQWRSALDSAWEVLVTGHPEVAAEVRALLRVLTPLAAPADGETSVTWKDAAGAVGLSTPRSAHGLALTLAHEVQHVKLNALLDIVQLTWPDDRRYYAPWREDPRPLDGLLQGAYAHLGVTAFWRRERARQHGDLLMRADVEFARWRTATDRAIRTLLGSGGLTPMGETFVTEMGEVLREWCTEPVPDQALARAAEAAERHRSRWRRRVERPRTDDPAAAPPLPA
ncbi:HEXXH motif domain-containing protein [Actinomadura sp. LD22]|uniref:HEXXH motif domain-containing protein n=1 Tax=Actinomadura physcomitrii TaxID=2650748 RepID=A0A6I4MRA1_9ACTN|nr:HEXXH motif domain-containing protein [Actinomadura physcomitrii]MWA06347.1 HEXXH motif domain-containing protein [Actinomadura physcomitrii]